MTRAIKKRMFYLLILSAVLVGCKHQHLPIALGGGYSLDYDRSLYFKIVDSIDNYSVEAHIMALGFDSTYIIARQKPVYELSDEARQLGINVFDKNRDYVSKSTLYYYWIIDKSNDSIYGPLTKEKYRMKRKELNVNTKLSLRRLRNNFYEGLNSLNPVDTKNDIVNGKIEE